MITGLPPYREPIVQSVRCLCGRFYSVFLGSEDYQARFAEKQAIEIGARFVDSRLEPWLLCPCGQVLDFMPECTVTVQ
jgi:hypothetical protein